ncbi:MAG: hypothetical protein ACREK8_04215, partial [Gemmatimonadales bacterium]
MERITAACAAAVLIGCGGRARHLAPIRLEPLVTFGADSGDGAMATEPRVSALHPDGFRIVIPAAGAGGLATAPLVYSREGRFLGTLQGGERPDEQFQVPLFARFGPGDSIWVFDGAGRALIFGRDRRYARTASLPVTPWDALVLTGGRMLVSPADANRPLPLLLLDSAGGLIRRFGGADTLPSRPLAPRWLARGSDGTFWSMPTRFRWRLEHWDSIGKLLSTVERRPAWFTPYARDVAPDGDHPPDPVIRGFWLGPLDRLWVLGEVADRTWRTGLASHLPGSAEVI